MGLAEMSRRKIIQIIFTLLTNFQVTNLISGKIYKGSVKQICAPGLNCYSCPAAILSCPIGALQTILGSSKFNFSFYVTGFLLLTGLMLGRAVCGFLCPFGFFQEILNKIPSAKYNLWRPLVYFKYLILLIFVLMLPIISALGKPAFCEYICTAGTFEAALPLLITHQEFRAVIGGLFALKLSILIITVIGCIFVYRFFCKLICPLGAIYGLMNKWSFYRLKVDLSRCINCGQCQKFCPMSVDPVKNPNSPECIRCNLCSKRCPQGAIKKTIYT